MVKSREIYFAIYQAIAGDRIRQGIYRDYSPSFFDLIIVDECHRGSSRDESNWREILSYFQPAYQLGLTATPLRDDNVDTYRYFGNPLYTYSLAQGIEDGFLAPYKVHRVTTTFDALGWRPSADELDRYGRTIPDEEYQTGDFERAVALKARTTAIARHITNALKKADRFAKTIVFCVDEDHVLEMVEALNNLNSDLVQQYPDYVSRITSDAGATGKKLLYKFMDVLEDSPVIAVTSKLLTTGVDVPTCKNVVLVRVIKSMTDFKQIVGRGTRVYEEQGKLSFVILDYTNSTRLFADPDFDGEPARIETEEMDEEGQTALLFLQLIMRLLKRHPKPGQAGVVVPNGTLFGDGVCAKIKEKLLTQYNLHTIVRLPNGVFAPYTSIPTNLLFFDASGATQTIWYYEVALPEGRKTYSKTKPMQEGDFEQCLTWWNHRTEHERAWKYDFKALYEKARVEAQPHWDAAREAEAIANQCARQIKELETQVQQAQTPRQEKALKQKQKGLQATGREQRELAKREQATGDSLGISTTWIRRTLMLKPTLSTCRRNSWLPTSGRRSSASWRF